MKQLLTFINHQIDWSLDISKAEGVKPEGQYYWRGYAHAMKEVKREIERVAHNE